MGEFDSTTAKLWMHEFEKAGIGFDEIVLIGNNLSELDNPKFIPNVFELIEIVSKVRNDIDYHFSGRHAPLGLPNLMSAEDTKKLRNKTEQTWRNSIAEMRSKLA